MWKIKWVYVMSCVSFVVVLHILLLNMEAAEHTNLIQYKQSLSPFNHSMYHKTQKQLKSCGGNDTYGYTDFAFVSMITSEGTEGMNDLLRYVRSAAKLGTSIRHWTNLDIVMMVFGSSELPLKHQITLSEAGWIVCYMSTIENPSSGLTNRFLSTKLYSKLNVWSLIEYEAVVMVDSDMLCIRNPVSLFTDVYSNMKQLGYPLAAAEEVPKTATFRCNYVTDKYNAGVLVLMPNMLLLGLLKEAIHMLPHNYEQAEQGLLNMYFKDRVHPLQYRYNANIAAPMCDPVLWDSEQEHIVFVHYTIVKPWIYSEHYVIWIIQKLRWNSPGYVYMLWEQTPVSPAHESLSHI